MEMGTLSRKRVNNVTMVTRKTMMDAHTFAKSKKDINAFRGICTLLASARINVVMVYLKSLLGKTVMMEICSLEMVAAQIARLRKAGSARLTIGINLSARKTPTTLTTRGTPKPSL